MFELEQGQVLLKKGGIKWHLLIKQINSGIKIGSLKLYVMMQAPCAAGFGVGFMEYGKNENFYKQI